MDNSLDCVLLGIDMIVIVILSICFILTLPLEKSLFSTRITLIKHIL